MVCPGALDDIIFSVFGNGEIDFLMRRSGLFAVCFLIVDWVINVDCYVLCYFFNIKLLGVESYP